MKKFSSKITALVSYSLHDNVWQLWLFVKAFPIGLSSRHIKSIT